MQQIRKKLTLRIASNDPADEGAPTLDGDAVAQRIAMAIGRKLCLSASYNRTQMVFAPHILYRRHDDLFVDGVVVERNGVPPRELKLGAFKLAGLSDVTLTARPFDRSDLFVPGEERYAEKIERTIED